MLVPLHPPRLLAFMLVLLVTALLFSGCATQKPFHFVADNAKVFGKPDAQPTDTLSLSTTIAAYSRVTPPEEPQLMASIASPVTALAQKPSFPKPQPLTVSHSKVRVPMITSKRKLPYRGAFSQEEPMPEGKAIRSLMTFGLASSMAALVVGTIGVVTLLGGGWAFMGAYLLLILLGALFYGMAFSKISKSPDPTVYARDRRLAKIALLISLIPVVALLILFLARTAYVLST